jgi:glycosyltransferase involved in cell wall biosynthesis
MPERGGSEPIPLGLAIGQLVRGGAERQLHALVAHLDRERFAPVVFCLSELTEPYGPRLRAAGVPVVAFPRRAHYDIGRALALAREARRRRIRLLHAFLLEASVYCAIARRLAGTPALVTSNRVALPGRDGLRRRFDGWAFRASRRVIVNSEAVREFTARTYGLPPGRMRVIYNGLDPAPFELARRSDEVRRALGAGPADLLVGTVGRVMPQKNPALFLEVARRVRAADPRARFAWIGAGALLDDLREQARNGGLEDALALPGPRDDVPEVLQAFDLFLLTSDAEGLPNAVLEAMAAARPVVATAAGGTPEALGDCGVIQPPGDAAGLAEAVVGLLREPERRRRMGAAGRSRVRERFSIAAMVAATQAVYEEALRG